MGRTSIAPRSQGGGGIRTSGFLRGGLGPHGDFRRAFLKAPGGQGGHGWGMGWGQADPLRKKLREVRRERGGFRFSVFAISMSLA